MSSQPYHANDATRSMHMRKYVICIKQATMNMEIVHI